MKKAGGFISFTLLISIIILAAAGDLDITFDTDGRVVTAVGAGSDVANAVAVQADGKIVVVGTTNNGTDDDFLIIRYNTDGSLDDTFDSDGIATVNFEQMMFSNDEAHGVAIDGDGKIVVGGFANDQFAFRDFAVARLTATGQLDTTFDTDGRATAAISNQSDVGNDIAIDGDGKIIIAGVTGNNTTFVSEIGIVRFLSTGALDTSFDTDGKVAIPVGSGNAQPYGVAIDSMNRIVIGGVVNNGGNLDFLAARVGTSGALDTTFDSDGVAITPIGASTDFGQDVAIGPDGKIVVAGYTFTGGAAEFDFALARYNPNGSLDMTFDSDGTVITDFNENEDFARAVVIQNDNKIIAVGDVEFNNSFITDFGVAKYNVNGSLDMDFGVGGKVATDFGPNGELGKAAALQADGKIIAAGSTAMANNDVAVARYENSGTGCTYSISPLTIEVANQVGSQQFSLTTGTGCNWMAVSDSGWLTVQEPSTGTGSATINYNYTANDGFPRTGTIAVEGQVHTLYQDSPPGLRIPKFDFDGDFRSDPSMFRPNGTPLSGKPSSEGSTSEWWIYKTSDGGNLAYGFGNPTDIPVAEDFTGDGKTDVAFWRPSTGQWFVLRSEDQTFYAFPFGAPGDIPAPGDFDGDREADPAVFRPSTGTWFILKSGTGGTVAIPFGADGDIPVVDDYDGDGVEDVAVHRPAAGQWWLLQSTAGVKAYSFGDQNDVPAVGDWTGDRKSDVAFYRPSTSLFYVIRSEDDSFFAFQWGAPGDLSVAEDYDGDATMDAAIWRPGDTTWYILGSTSGFQAIPFGAAGDVPLQSRPSAP